ncbi:hypothetical protein PVAND_010984 [Polypedilum vanderplanki]|uniref:Uncharacterized protein n=1 Tax=Polypedilum vanderplanki TaxID=319348 RepID=A0A9J6CHY8_POLVA|nr:hypothetical protein PVAND_010984 [Polypedilum vanderplanki]
MEQSNQKVADNPREKANFVSIVTFFWTIPLFRKGYKKVLEIEDLYRPLKVDESENLGDRLEQNWTKQLNGAKKPSLMRALSRTFWKEYMILGLYAFTTDIVIRLSLPFFLGRLLDYFSPKSTLTKDYAYFYASMLVLINIGGALFVNQFILGSFSNGMKVRLATCSLIYRKALKLSTTALGNTSVGKVVNLLSNDVSRFDIVSVFIHAMWLAPLLTIIVGILLYQEVGTAGLVGILVIGIVTPLQSYTGKLSSKFRLQTAIRTDERVRLMDEIINGIQVIKLYAWEKSFKKLIQNARMKELKVIKKSSYIRALYMTFMLFTTRSALYCTMMAIVVLGDELTASKVFVISSYFQIISSVMSQMFVRGIAEIAEAFVGIKRLQTFLEYDEKEEKENIQMIQGNALNDIGKTKDKAENHMNHINRKSEVSSNIVLSMQNVCCRWKSVEENLKHNDKKNKESDNNQIDSANEYKLTLSDISLEIKRGLLVGVLGHVGSGKSSLLQTILRELPIISGKMHVNGTLSFASQEPWVFSGSIRQNILFGSEMNKERYDRVVAACALKKDFEMFPHGDHTLIGERGSSLSGGQKARLSLARSLYREAQIYLLDDPLSAVDAHVGKHLFEECLAPRGFLGKQHATRILVTHQVHFLKNADWLIIMKDGKIEQQGYASDLMKDETNILKIAEEAEEQDTIRRQSFSRSLSARSSNSINSNSSKETGTNDDDDETRSEHEVQKNVEEMSKGKVKGNVTLNYLKAGGDGCKLSFALFLFLLTQAIASTSDMFVGFWTNQEELRQYYSSINATESNENATLILEDTTMMTTTDVNEVNLLPSDILVYIGGVLIVALFIIAIVRSIVYYSITQVNKIFTLNHMAMNPHKPTTKKRNRKKSPGSSGLNSPSKQNSKIRKIASSENVDGRNFSSSGSFQDDLSDNMSSISSNHIHIGVSSQQKQSKCKPVFIESGYQVISNLIKNCSFQTNPTLKIINNNKVSVLTSSEKDKEALIKKLSDQKFQFYTFAEKGKRNDMFVLKGFYQTSKEILLNLLKDSKIPAIFVKQISYNADRPIYIVQFEYNTTNIHQLNSSYRVIDSIYVRWELLDKKKKTHVQCSKCRRWGHTQANCGYKPRCIKCINDHEPGKCPRTSRIDTEDCKVTCVNCNGNHPANSRICPEFTKYLMNIENSKPKKLIRQSSFANPVNTEIDSSWPKLPATEPSGSRVNPRFRASYAEAVNAKNKQRSVSFNSNVTSDIDCKKPELDRFVVQHNIDICLLSETWLKEDSRFFMSGYNLHSVFREHGGVSILIKNTIPVLKIDNIVYSYAEAIIISIESHIGLVQIASIYISPAANRSQSAIFFERLLKYPGQLIIAGDVNAKHQSWNNTNNTHKGIDLFNIASRNNCTIHPPDSPTLYSCRGSISTVDLLITKAISGISSPLTHNDLSSDHMPILFSFSKILSLDERRIFNWKKANWKKFKDIVNTNSVELTNRPINSTDDIDNIIQSLTENIIQASIVSIPKKKPYRFRYPFSSRLDLLCKERTRLRNRYKVTLRHEYKSLINQLNRLIKFETSKINKESFESRLASLKTDDNTAFSFVKALRKSKNTLPPLCVNGNLSYSNIEKANVLAKNFLSNHLNTCNQISPHEQLVNDTVIHFRSQQHNCDFSTTPENITEIIQNLKLRKAAGFDNIKTQFLKNLPQSSIQLISNIFNHCLKFGYFPQQWKHAKIIALPKKDKDSSNPNNFRPISLLSTIGKLFERTILNFLIRHEVENNLFINQQFGFRSKHSTTLQIIRIVESASIGFNHNRSTGMVLLDIQKAFDSVWLNGLVFKLIKLKFPSGLIKIIDSFLFNRTAQVDVNQCLSDTFSIPAGVPQGSALSPFLFNLFINDLPKLKKGELAAFADDLAIFYTIRSKNPNTFKKAILNDLSYLSKFYGDWKISLNKDKTEFIIFTRAYSLRNKLANDSISFQNKQFKWLNQVKYLGVILDQRLNFNAHIQHTISKAKKALFSIYSIFKNSNPVPASTKVNLYKSLIRPILSYAAPVFINCPKTYLKKLQVVQNMALRMCTNSSRYTRLTDLHELARTPFVQDFFLKLTNQLYSRTQFHDNPLIKILGDYNNRISNVRIKHNLPKP